MLRNQIFCSLIVSILFLPIVFIHPAFCKAALEKPVMISLYPTGNERPLSATSPVYIHEYKSEWINPSNQPLNIDLDKFQLRNWTGLWTLITQSRKIIDLNLQKAGEIEEPFFLRCELHYSGNLHREALEAWYTQHPDEYPIGVPFPSQKVQESIIPQVLLVPAQGVLVPSTPPKPSLFKRLFGAKTPKRAEQSDSPPNVVIILIDTLRLDHTPPGGHPFIIAPHIDMLASMGVFFSESYGASSSTRPSVGSIFTGLQPMAHGAERHTMEGSVLHMGVPFLAEQFLLEGYNTAAVSSNAQICPAFGFKRGFQTFESSVWESQVTNRGLWHLRNLDEPFFLYLHYMGPHQPYEPSYPWKGMYAGQTRVPDSLPSSKQITSASNALHDAYAEEITQEDHRIGLILQEMAHQGLLGNSIIWLVSDHGEEFWEHWWNGHGANVFEESVRTLSILSQPSVLPLGKSIQTPIMQVDMFPTLTEMLQWKPQAFCQGLSLLPLIEDRPSPEILQRPVFLHHGGGTQPAPHPSDKEAVLLNRKKLILWPQKKQWEFYGLQSDPFEQKNIDQEDDPTIQSMKPLLNQHLEQSSQIAEKVKSLIDLESPQLSPQEEENLKAHGYLH